jgi:hypothetical protein
MLSMFSHLNILYVIGLYVIGFIVLLLLLSWVLNIKHIDFRGNIKR